MNNIPEQTQNTSGSNDPLSLRRLRRAVAWCERFEAEFRGGGSPRIELYLMEAEEAERPELVRELVSLELALRRERGESPTFDAYRDRFPDLADEIAGLFVARQVDGKAESSAGPEWPESQSGGTAAASASGLMTVDAFLRALVDLGLVDTAEAETYRDSATASPTTARQAAQVLIAQGKLTAYQAGVILDRGGGPLVLDRYVILDRIGSGGMGTVYKARHRTMDRIVALKTLPFGDADTTEKVRRFVREARAAARLDHPNIVAAFDAQSDRGVPFLVMEYVPGETLADLVARQGPLSVADAAYLLAQAARGLAHAHARGVVHRDIKPRNLIRTADGVLKVLDMGLASFRHGGPADERGTDSDLTRDEAILGTIAYMAPEQTLDARAADHRADIYSLGCTLHFLLTGKAPFQTGHSLQDLLAHREAAIPSLRGLRPDVPPALDALFVRMLAKRPEDRPDSASDVAEALEAAASRPPEPMSPVADDARARPGRKAWRVVAGLVATACLAGLLVALGRVSPIGRALGPTPSAHPAPETKKGGATASASASAAVRTPTTPADRPGALPGLIPAPATIRGLGRWQVETVLPRGGSIEALAASPDGSRIALADGTGTVRILDATSFALVLVLLGHTQPVVDIAWSPDGGRIATASHDQTVRLWSAVDGTPGPVLRGHASHVHRLAWSRDGTRIASASSDSTARVWSVDGQPVARLQGHLEELTGVAWSPDGQTLATSSNDQTARLWAAATGAPGKIIHRGKTQLNSIAWSSGPAEGLLAVGEADGSIRLYSPDGALRSEQRGVAGPTSRLSWREDGRALAIGCANASIHVWDVDDQGRSTARPPLKGLAAPVYEVGWLPDGGLISAATWERSVRFWKPDGAPDRVHDPVSMTRPRRFAIHSLAWAPDSRRIVTGLTDLSIRLWTDDGTPGSWGRSGGPVDDVAWNPSGTRFVFVSEWGPWINVVDPNQFADRSMRWKGTESSTSRAAWSPDGAWVAVGYFDGTIGLFEASTGRTGPLLRGHTSKTIALAWNPDASLLASASQDGTVRIWPGKDGAPGPVLRGHSGEVRGLAWGPEGRWLASAASDGSIRIWTADGAAVRQLRRNDGAGYLGLAVSPDRETLAALIRDRGSDIELLSARGESRGVLHGHDGPPLAVGFSPDGRWIATGGTDETLRLWNANTREPIWIALMLADGRSVRFRPNGERFGADPGGLDNDLTYLVEAPSGRLERLTPSEFDRRAGSTDSNPKIETSQ